MMWLWPILMFYSNINLAGQRETTNSLNLVGGFEPGSVPTASGKRAVDTYGLNTTFRFNHYSRSNDSFILKRRCTRPYSDIFCLELKQNYVSLSYKSRAALEKCD